MGQAKAEHCSNVFQFNRDNLERINNICSPLNDHFGIVGFGHGRFFDNGKYLFISNTPLILESTVGSDCFFRSDYFKKHPNFFCKYEPFKDVWPENAGDHLIDLYRENGFYNGYSIVSENEGTNESTFFVTKNDDTHIKDFYKNHSSVLDSFLDHFKSIAPDIFDLTDESKLGFSPYVNETYPKIEKIFLKSTPWERILDNFSASLESQFNDEIETIMKIHFLTKREIQCLIMLSRGDTGKEVARKLNISPRTVESHINKLRIKTNRQTKVEIIHWFKEVFKPFLNDKSSRINSTFCCNI